MIGILGNFDKDMLSKARHASKYFAKNGMLYERAPGKSGYNYIRPKKSSLQARLKCDNPTFVDFVSSLLTLRSEKRLVYDLYSTHISDQQQAKHYDTLFFNHELCTNKR